MNLENDVYNADFVGVKVGDISNNCTECSIPLVRPNDYPSLLESHAVDFYIPDLSMDENQEYLLPVKVKNGSDKLSLYSFGLQFDQTFFELIEVVQGDFPDFSFDNFNLEALDKGELRHLWLTGKAGGQLLEENTTIFFARVKARRSVNSIKGLIREEADLIEPIAYFYTEKAYPVRFEVRQSNEPSIFPNPFSNQLTVQMPVNGIQDVKITIVDATGRTVHVYRAEKVAGQLNWTWNPEQKLPSGIYYYQIDLGPRSLKGKLLRVN